MPKLENFIENYLKNKKISDYEGWLALYGKDATSAFQSAKAEADTAYTKAKAEHGARASALYQKGLAVSGYSDYLNHTAYAKRSDAIGRALQSKKATEAENQKGYLSYLESEAEAEAQKTEAKAKEKDAAFNALLSQKILDEPSAITFLTARGIDEENARAMAKESIAILRGSKSYRDQVIAEATGLRMNFNNAYEYARLKGLPENAAREVANIAAFATRQKASYKYYYYN